MSEPLVKVKVHEAVGTIILNRPEKRNALSRQLLADLSRALNDLYLERSVRAVILTGAGKAFCAGMDLDQMRETAQLDNATEQFGEDAQTYRDVIVDMLQFPKPILAAVGGPAVAGGAGLMLACDVVIAAPEAKFGLPEPRRGIVAGIVAPLLAFRVGGGQAAKLLMTSSLIDAAAAQRIGLYHELVAGDLVWARAQAVAAECAGGAPEALQLTRQLIYETIGADMLTAISAGTAISATARTTESAAEGLRAFLEKRDPLWH